MFLVLHTCLCILCSNTVVYEIICVPVSQCSCPWCLQAFSIVDMGINNQFFILSVYCSAMACSSKSSKLWSAMSAILCRGLICCVDNMVLKWLYLRLDDIFIFCLFLELIQPSPTSHRTQKESYFLINTHCQDSGDNYCQGCMTDHATTNGVYKWNIQIKNLGPCLLNDFAFCSMYSFAVTLNHSYIMLGY